MSKLINKFKKKIVVLASVMIALQPLLGLAVLPAKTFAATETVVEWNFPDATADNVADGGISANAAKTISTTGGTSAIDYTAADVTRSAHATGWDSGSDIKSWQVEFTTVGYNDIKLSSAQRSSGTGPRDFKVQYSVNSGATWTDVSGGTVTTADNYTLGVLSGISLPADVNNQPSVSLQWIITSNTAVDAGTVGASGASNIDNIVVTGVATTTPALTEVTPVATLTNDTTPDYTFNSTEAGAITYGGDCTSVTPTAVVGNNPITFSALADGLHNNCTVTVTNTDGTSSTPLSITPFTVDTTAPVITLVGANPQTIEQGQAYTELGATVTDINPTTPAYISDGATVVDTAKVGTYAVTYNATDLAGNTATPVTRTVNVVSPKVDTPIVTGPAVPTVVTTVAEIPVDEQFGGSSEQGEVKADTTVKPDNGGNTENKEEKKEETKGKKNIPLWGIIFLLVLAGIGGYLFYSQSPDKSKK